MDGQGASARWDDHLWPAVALPVCSLILILGPDGFPFITIRAFLLPGALLLLLAGLLFALWRMTWTVDGAILSAMICTLPTLLPIHPVLCKGGSLSVKLAQMNVQQENSDFAGVIAAARAIDADVLSVQEVDARWDAALQKGLTDLYPYHLVGTAEVNYGIAVFSRMPMKDAEIFDLCGLPAIRSIVHMNQKDVLVLMAHLRLPESSSDLHQRNLQWMMLADQVQKFSGPVVVVGDLNTVPWDDAAKRFNISTAMSWGPRPLAPTWPSIAGISLIPLDHILSSPGICILSTNTFTIPGSDHRGLSASVAMGH